MILSKISRNIEDSKSYTALEKNHKSGIIFFGLWITAIGILLTVLQAGSIMPLDLLIWRPILIFGVITAVLFWLKVWLKLDLALAWEKIEGGFLWAGLTALVFGLINVWQYGSGLLPLSLKGIGYYFLTLGFWPINAGPESFLRGFVFGLAVFFVVREYKNTRQDIKSLTGGIGLWFFGSLILLAPSFSVWSALWFIDVNSLGLSGAEMVKEFSRLNINTYWSDGQIVRWFTGFGGQLPAMMALFSASWVFVLSFVLWVLSFWAPRSWAGFGHQKITAWLFLLSAPLTGLSLGWSRRSVSSLDLASWLVLVVVFYSFFSLMTQARDDRAPNDFAQSWRLYFVLLGSALLGWTVFLPAAAALGIYWLSQKLSAGGNQVSHEMHLCAQWPFLAGLALAFIRRGDVITQDMNWGLVVFWVLASMALVLPWFINKYGHWQIVIGWWLLAGLGATFWLKTIAALAVVAFFVLISQFLRKKISRFDLFWPYLILASFFVVFILIFLAPRLMQSKMMPL